jgi:NAD(P)-dependent dehydrogenase (short-subunit alcohol dehydrogenase family)
MAQRVAAVTGANRGLGLETARQLLAHGLRVALTGRDLQAVERALDGVEAAPGSAIAVAMDVTDPSSIKRAHGAIVKAFGSVDVIVNNAAILLFESSDVLETPLDGFRETFETNCFGVIEVCREFVPPMVERGYGRVVNVSSGAGQVSKISTYAPAYSMSKSALNAFTRILAQTYRHAGVLANVVDPGWVRTDMGGPSAPRSVQQGADTTVWLATLPDSGPTGGFFRDRRPIEW